MECSTWDELVELLIESALASAAPQTTPKTEEALKVYFAADKGQFDYYPDEGDNSGDCVIFKKQENLIIDYTFLPSEQKMIRTTYHNGKELHRLEFSTTLTVKDILYGD